MPNFCDCELRVKGPPTAVERFLDCAHGSEGDESEGDEIVALDFNKFVPMPKELAETKSDSYGSIGYDAWYGDWGRLLEYPWVKEAGVTTQEQLQEFLKAKDPQYEAQANRYKSNTERFGHPTWYEWARANWGTKWNAGDATASVSRTGRSALIRFATAWSPPEPVIRRMGEMFPELEFSLRYYEGGGGFQGLLRIKGGRVVEEWDKDYHGRRGG